MIGIFFPFFLFSRIPCPPVWTFSCAAGGLHVEATPSQVTLAICHLSSRSPAACTEVQVGVLASHCPLPCQQCSTDKWLYKPTGCDPMTPTSQVPASLSPRPLFVFMLAGLVVSGTLFGPTCSNQILYEITNLRFDFKFCFRGCFLSLPFCLWP